MTVLVVAVVLVAALCLLDLLLTFGVIRRLKQHTVHLEDLLQRRYLGQDILPVGSRIGEFEAVTADGRIVSGGTLTGNTVVAFFSTECGPCKEALPGFVEAARETPGQVLAVVAGDAERAAEMVERLAAVSLVVVEEMGGPVSRAFEANAFPGYCVVDAEGYVIATGPTSCGRRSWRSGEVDRRTGPGAGVAGRLRHPPRLPGERAARLGRTRGHGVADQADPGRPRHGRRTPAARGGPGRERAGGGWPGSRTRPCSTGCGWPSRAPPCRAAWWTRCSASGAGL